MKRKVLKIWVHYRRNAPLFQTLVVVLGIFTVFQNCGRTVAPPPSPVLHTSTIPSPTDDLDPANEPGGSDVEPGLESQALRFPIERDSHGNPLFQPGRPFGLSVDANRNVAIASYQGPLVLCMNANGHCSTLTQISRTPAGLSPVRPSAIGVVILPDSRIAYVDHDAKSLHLQVSVPSAKTIEWQVTSLEFSPYAIASNANGTRLYITGEEGTGAVCQTGTSETKTACTLHKALSGFDVAVSPEGSVYVANATSLQVCTETVSNCRSHSFPDGRTMAVGIASGSALFVSDYFGNRILKCSLARNSLSCEDFLRGLNVPRVVRLDPKGNVYVTEYNSNRVLRFDPAGKPF